MNRAHLEECFAVPVWILAVQVLLDVVVQAHPDGVHRRQTGLIVTSIVAYN